MTDRLTEALLKRFTTTSEPAYLYPKFARPVQDAKGEWWNDPLDKRITDVLALPRPVQLAYNAGQTLGNHAMVVYGTVTLGWLILLMSGYKYAREIPEGTVIQLPTRASLFAFVTDENDAERVGQSQTF